MPALFSGPFVEVLGRAIEGGLVSVRRVADLLDLTVDELADCLPHTASRALSTCEAQWRDTLAPCS